MVLATCIVEHGRLVGGERPDLVVPWWSFGKTVLAAAAMVLVEHGRLSLDAPLPDRPETLRQLLQHTAGLGDYGDLPAYHRAVADGEPPWSREDMLLRADAERHLTPPGQAWGYSNIGYLRVAELVEAAAGLPLREALARLVLRPLGAEGARLATQPAHLIGVQMGAAAGYHPAWVYHGLLVGPLEDAARLLDRLLAGELLAPDLLAQMQDGWPLPHFARGAFVSPAYGLGLMTPQTRAGFRMLGHTGGGPGSSFAAYAVDGGDRTMAAFALDEDPICVEETVFALATAP